MISRIWALFALLVATAACTSATSGTPTPATPTKAQFLRADPCGFIDPAALRRFGELTAVVWDGFAGCRGTITTESGGEADLSLSLELALPVYPKDAPQLVMTPVDGVPVYRLPNDQGRSCTRFAVPMPDVVIAVAAQPCAVSDAVTSSVVTAVRAGRFPPAPFSARSLAWRNACALLDLGEAKVSGAPNEAHPAFAGHACTWGASGSDDPGVTVELSLSGPPDPDEQRIDVAGHQARVRLDKGDESLSPTTPDCAVSVYYQPLRQARGQAIEVATVKVQAAAARPESLCTQATELATTVIHRLDG